MIRSSSSGDSILNTLNSPFSPLLPLPPFLPLSSAVKVQLFSYTIILLLAICVLSATKLLAFGDPICLKIFCWKNVATKRSTVRSTGISSSQGPKFIEGSIFGEAFFGSENIGTLKAGPCDFFSTCD